MIFDAASYRRQHRALAERIAALHAAGPDLEAVHTGLLRLAEEAGAHLQYEHLASTEVVMRLADPIPLRLVTAYARRADEHLRALVDLCHLWPHGGAVSVDPDAFRRDMDTVTAGLLALIDDEERELHPAVVEWERLSVSPAEATQRISRPDLVAAGVHAAG
jgi:hypothetical protein